MIVASSTLLLRHHDHSNRWRLAPFWSSMRLIHINGLFAVVAQICALVAINCCCHCHSLLRLNVGHEYRIDNVVVLQSSLASLMGHKKHSPHCCRWCHLQLQGWLPRSSSSCSRGLQWWPKLSPPRLVTASSPGGAFGTRFYLVVY